MNESRISVRYSRALFQSAVDKNLLDKINQDMILIREFCKNTEMSEFLKSPIIVPSKKKDILHKIFGNEINPLTMALLDLVVDHGREGYVPAIARVFITNTLKYNGITESVLTTAVKVDSAVAKRVSELISRLFNTKVDLEEKVNPDIIGGFILKVDDNYINASVQNKLRKIRKELNASGGAGARL